ncbi:MAG: dihydroorotase [Ignavibacteriaceae bacterium]|jgi:dihydroorotase|nr:dihydroorotase [Ignavibacteriaceae bacterium]MCW8817992.1 dihydroorotase [Ignavibacteriaceae bacterium]MCW8960970.1 dihydroorotase [Ignavibacteriaceae bacterium]MCW9094870.1 dihydroorotase [Ignavibacteriaceae bacterium]MCW9097062.1 dihydroorotase [Ignavibacteriaceae bacterium]
MKIILKNVDIIHPEDIVNLKGTSVLVDNGIISKIGELNQAEIRGAKEFDFSGKILVPGLFDMHVHLREPGREDEETVLTGCNSAAAGGFTGVACMPNTEPDIDTAEVVKFIKEQAANHLVDVYPVAAASLGRKGEIISPMAELVEAGAVAFSDDGVAIRTSAVLRRAFEYANMYNTPIIEHCEDESLADGAMNEGVNSTLLGLPALASVAEDIIVSRDILMAEYTGGRIHIAHISTKNSVNLVRDAKKKGIKVTAEVTPHHFTLTDDAVKSYDTNFKMNPPLRTQDDIIAIIKGIKDGTIDCIASDHAPHSIEEKETEFQFAPNGIVGLETIVGLSSTELLHKNKISIEELVNKLSINPRRILNIPIPKFEVGAVANFTIIDPDLVWTVDVSKFKSKSKNSPFDKRLLTGKAIAVINRKKMYADNQWIDLVSA